MNLPTTKFERISIGFEQILGWIFILNEVSWPFLALENYTHLLFM